jgi:phage portal protein BeeE
MSEKQREEASGAASGAATGSSSEEAKKVMVSPVQVLLGAIDLATTRGAFRIAELQLITQAYGMLTQKPAAEGQEQTQEQKESPIPELERAIQNAMGKN